MNGRLLETRFVQPIKNMVEKCPVAWVLAVNVVFMTFVVLALPFTFDCVDDTNMMWRMAGYYFNSDFHTFYINVIYAWIEWKLYTLVPSVEWHTWLFLAVHCASLTAIGFSVVKTSNPLWAKLVLFLLVYCVEVFNLVHMQFTTTAGLAATAGMLLVVKDKKYGMGLLLFVLGSLIRFNAAMFCGLMTAALYPFAVLRHGFDRKQLGMLALCAAAGYALHRVDVAVYMSDDYWKERYTYDMLRGKVYDNSNMWRVYSSSAEGITREDLDGMGGVYVPDWEWENREHIKGILSEEKLERFLEVVEEQTAYKGIPGLKKVKNIPLQLSGFRLPFAIALFVIVACLLNSEQRKERIALLFGALCFPMILAYMALDVRLNFRAFFCGWMPLMLMASLLTPFKRKASWLCYVVASALMVQYTYNWMPESSPHSPKEKYRMQKELVEIGKSQGANYLFNWADVPLYAFGQRLPIQPYNLSDVTEMVDNDEYVVMSPKQEMEDCQSFLKTLLDRKDASLQVEFAELCSNGTYVLFRLVSTQEDRSE